MNKKEELFFITWEYTHNGKKKKRKNCAVVTVRGDLYINMALLDQSGVMCAMADCPRVLAVNPEGNFVSSDWWKKYAEELKGYGNEKGEIYLRLLAKAEKTAGEIREGQA